MALKYQKFHSIIKNSSKKREIIVRLIVLLVFLFVLNIFFLFPFYKAIVVFIILLSFFFYYINPVYLYRLCFINIAIDRDVRKFPCVKIKKSRKPFFFKKDVDNTKINVLLNKVLGDEAEKVFNYTKTSSFIIFSNDKIVYEKYFNGSGRKDLQLTYSITKSFISFLVGVAIKEQKITSIHDTLDNYLPELCKRDKDFSKISILHLLTMSSGIRFTGGHGSLFGDDTREGFTLNLRKDTLMNSRIETSPGKQFFYNNYNTNILGLIVEKIFNQSISKLLEEKFFEQLGAEFDAEWAVDSKKYKFEKTSSGLRMSAIDLLKLGYLYLNNGKFLEKEIVSENWVKESVSLLKNTPKEYYNKKSFFSPFFNNKNAYYKYLWWCKSENEHTDFIARGINSQFIFVSPKNKVIIVRCGFDYGFSPDDWIEIFTQISNGCN